MNNQHTESWPDLAISLFERLTGANAEITYEFDRLAIDVPSGPGPEATFAKWQVTGTMKIRTKKIV